MTRRQLRAAPRPAAPLTFAVGATSPSAAELRAALAVYGDPRGGYRCPLCAAPLRVLDGPPARIVGCPDASDLAELTADAERAGWLGDDGSAAA